ncbi:EboA domain-containing protein [Fodinibius salsisoli]|uniref:EboA domain-containing protein n=1 Tax=Fodinibius salsisoli TaxID=2820877 RepID=A0ABT3PPL3_9BACT|nr:EboA domain-containing protein [Fodinibius salsisoli]MCW9707803.1 EboA domain-containing protein [Fodinibius salsisoli]
MADAQQEIALSTLQSLIHSWIEQRLDGEVLDWLNSTSKKLQGEAEDWEFFASFSGVPQKTGKAALELKPEEIEAARNIRPGWQPEYWSLDELARTSLVLSIAERDQSYFLDILEKTFVASDIGEAVALYQSLAILPYPEQLDKRAAEGIRSNMTSVFNAVALRNPYPADYMDQGAWNQVVLKALFVESPLYLIEGIDRRANEKLAHMLVDYAHERWAAGRSVSPELWRSVGPFAEGDMIGDLEKVLTHEDEIQQQAAVLALSASLSEEAKGLLNQHSEIVKRAKEKKANWDDIGARFNNNDE